MTQERYQLEDSAVQVYETQKVGAIFGPLARATLDAVPMQKGDTALDVACGTGIVARTIRERYGGNVTVTGSDLNAGMIEMARAITKDLDPPIEWSVSDATDLPFEDGRFSVCLCQQGIQFFPDKGAALTEFRRVLAPQGRLAITVWDGASVFFRAMADALRRHVGEDAAQKSLAPFAYRGGDELPALLAQSGFRNPSVQALTVDRIMGDPEAAVPREIFGNPVGAQVREKGEETLRLIVDEILGDCADFASGQSLVIPQQAHLVTAGADHR